MGIIIREIDDRDYLAVASLIQHELGYSELDINKFSLRMELIESDSCYVTFVAESDKQIVGFMGLHKGIPYEVDRIYLRIVALAVSQEHQGKGIGTSLLKCAEDYANLIGATALSLTSSFKRVEAHAFYEKNGLLKSSYGFLKMI